MTNDMRIYPDFVLPFDDEPTREDFKITHIDGMGKAMIALRKFKQGELICRFTGILTYNRTKFTVEYSPGEHIYDPWFMGMVCHGCDPTVKLDMMKRTAVAAKDIKVGDPITFDYEEIESELAEPFDCNCGSDKCRGSIKGRRGRECDKA